MGIGFSQWQGGWLMSTAVQAILAVMNEVQAVGKKERNLQQNFNFRGIDAVINAVGPAFRKHGAFIVPTVAENVASTVPSKSGGQLNVVRLLVDFAIYGQEGEPVVGRVASEAFDSGDKATAKAMSVALRTFLLQTLCLPTDEPDPDESTYEIAQAGPTVNEVKSQIKDKMPGKSPLQIREHITNVTGKGDKWTVEELVGVLEGLE